MSQNNQGTEPTQANLAQWASSYSLTTVPVLGFTAVENSFPGGLAFTLEADLYIPTVYQVGRDMTVLAADTTSSNPAAYF